MADATLHINPTTALHLAEAIHTVTTRRAARVALPGQFIVSRDADGQTVVEILNLSPPEPVHVHA